MNDQTFAVIWILSFGLYFLVYTFWIPLRTRKNIETWLRSSESDDTLLMSLEVIVKRIREQTLVDFEEFMLPQARENLQKFWAGAMGNAAKELKGSEEGSQLSLLHNMTQDLSGQPWYVQAAASKLLPLITQAAAKGTKTKTDAVMSMGLQK
tara:strand:- start:195 stop:650 length:456 start_codon:yes stop_codon:yes gene_type:complete